MPRNVAFSIQNNFTKGLITEATGLTFPENACTEIENCVIERTGLVKRRLGFDFEANFENETLSTSANTKSTYQWESVAGNGDISFAVVQIGNTLHFYQVLSDSPLSASKHSDTIDLLDFLPSGVTTVATIECQFSDGNGLLFVTNPRLETFYVTYDPDADTLTGTQIDLMIRDLEGDAADSLAIDNRPTSTLAALTAAHRYNLMNQGWTTTNLTAWDTARTDMPSNADVNWYFKSATDTFDFATVNDRAVGNSPAPKGHFIYNLYDIDRSTNFAGAADEEITINRLATSAFYAGRVFYAGLKEPKYNSRIFFSQVVERPDQYGKCYTINDQTSETLFDLLPTDGGFIDILEAGTIVKMVPVLNALIVFASNGVWAITGSQGIGFAANDYTISKISDVKAIGPSNFVSIEGIPTFWNADGIYTVTVQQGNFQVVSMTEQSIDTYYKNTIPAINKLYARGIYSPIDKEIQWVWRSSVSESFEQNYEYDRVLIYRPLTQAFYLWSIDDTDVKIHGIFNVTSAGGAVEEAQVMNSADTVIDGANNVVAFVDATGSANSLTFVTKYLVSFLDGANTEVTFGECYRDTYLDWESLDEGLEFISYLVTGYAVRGQAFRKFQSNYINILSETSSDSSFRIRGQWNYSIVPDSGKWTAEQVFDIVEEQTQTFSLTAGDGFSYKPKRIKIRGHGQACQFRIVNNGTKPFFIVGWSVFETGNKWI